MRQDFRRSKLMLILPATYAIPMDVDIILYTQNLHTKKKKLQCYCAASNIYKNKKSPPTFPFFFFDVTLYQHLYTLLSYSFQCRNACNILSILYIYKIVLNTPPLITENLCKSKIPPMEISINV